MNKKSLVITSIAGSENLVLKMFAEESAKRGIPFTLIGDTKSPIDFSLKDCNFFSIERQKKLKFSLAGKLPVRHYARKNLGYLVAISEGSDIIIETDDDNIPMDGFWGDRTKETKASIISETGWTNVYKYFTDEHIWPRGFALEYINNELPVAGQDFDVICPVQQGLADMNPDVDAIFRLTMKLPVNFEKKHRIALGNKSICPFNSQNTTWFREAFLLMYLPSYCSFRMTDIWRSFVAQRIAWTCDWFVLFHESTVTQSRNDHNIMIDFQDEISGYLNNRLIMQKLCELDLKEGIDNISENMVVCYSELCRNGFIGKEEINLLVAWIDDFHKLM